MTKDEQLRAANWMKEMDKIVEADTFETLWAAVKAHDQTAFQKKCLEIGLDQPVIDRLWEWAYYKYPPKEKPKVQAELLAGPCW